MAAQYKIYRGPSTRTNNQSEPWEGSIIADSAFIVHNLHTFYRRSRVRKQLHPHQRQTNMKVMLHCTLHCGYPCGDLLAKRQSNWMFPLSLTDTAAPCKHCTGSLFWFGAILSCTGSSCPVLRRNLTWGYFRQCVGRRHYDEVSLLLTFHWNASIGSGGVEILDALFLVWSPTSFRLISELRRPCQAGHHLVLYFQSLNLSSPKPQTTTLPCFSAAATAFKIVLPASLNLTSMQANTIVPSTSILAISSGETPM